MSSESVPKRLYDEILEKYAQINQEKAKLEENLAERNKLILILKVRSRIEELEKRFLKVYMLQYSRHQKWTAILQNNPRTLRNGAELRRFRRSITVPLDEFISTICSLYGEFSDLAAHNIAYPVPYDEVSVTQMLNHFGMTADRSKINTVVALLTPIP